VIRIARGGVEDLEPAVDVYVRASIARNRGQPVPKSRVDDVRESLQRPDARFLVADDNGVVVGMTLAEPSRISREEGRLSVHNGPLIPHLCHLYLLFVVPERWGEGIGRKLLDAIVTDASEQGYSRIHLFVHDGNDRAFALYRNGGFAPTGLRFPGISDPQIYVNEWARSL
jgi:ribosomal protein S18 acetylase RimI-like enzyme